VGQKETVNQISYNNHNNTGRDDLRYPTKYRNFYTRSNAVNH